MQSYTAFQFCVIIVINTAGLFLPVAMQKYGIGLLITQLKTAVQLGHHAGFPNRIVASLDMPACFADKP